MCARARQVGPSHRSRSSDAMKTSLASWMELAWAAAAALGTAGLAAVYAASWRMAPRIDVLYGDRDTEEEQVPRGASSPGKLLCLECF